MHDILESLLTGICFPSENPITQMTPLTILKAGNYVYMLLTHTRYFKGKCMI